MISVAVMAHPKRQQWVPDLVDRLDADVEVVWDQKNDRWDTGRRSLLAYHKDATHHLVVQDDALVCNDLVAGLTEAVRYSTFHPVGLYVGNVRPNRIQVAHAIQRTQNSGASWIDMEGPWWGVGILLPVEHIDKVVAFGDAKTSVANYDMKISRWYLSQNIDCWYTFPSLVEHRHGDGNPSLVPGRTATDRKAHRFIGEDASALDVDWSVVPGSYREAAGMNVYKHVRTGKEIRVLAGSHAERRLIAKPNHWQPVEVVDVEMPEPDEPSPGVDEFHTGAGWYTLPDGTKVRGRDNAAAALEGAV